MSLPNRATYFETRSGAQDAFDRTNAIPQSLGAIPVLDEAQESTLSMIRGEIPDDVVAEIERVTAEKSIQGGFSGQAARNLTSRDLGLTSLELSQQGIQNAATLGQLETQRQQFESEMTFNVAQFRENIRKFESEFALALSQDDQSRAGVELSALQLLTQTELMIQGMTNDLIIANSSAAIEGLQGHLDDMTGGIDSIVGNINNFVGNF